MIFTISMMSMIIWLLRYSWHPWYVSLWCPFCLKCPWCCVFHGVCDVLVQCFTVCKKSCLLYCLQWCMFRCLQLCLLLLFCLLLLIAYANSLLLETWKQFRFKFGAGRVGTDIVMYSYIRVCTGCTGIQDYFFPQNKFGRFGPSINHCQIYQIWERVRTVRVDHWIGWSRIVCWLIFINISRNLLTKLKKIFCRTSAF
jgi:hypothetical protein